VLSFWSELHVYLLLLMSVFPLSRSWAIVPPHHASWTFKGPWMSQSGMESFKCPGLPQMRLLLNCDFCWIARIHPVCVSWGEMSAPAPPFEYFGGTSIGEGQAGGLLLNPLQ
jgi:hypothetical protein